MQSTTTPQKATQLSNFTHKPADQSGSTLLQLPREILIQILCCLLTSAEPLSLQHGLQVETSRIEYRQPPPPEEQPQMTWFYPIQPLSRIFEQILKDDVLSTASETNSKPNFHLAPQIMRCSQLLYTTSHPVLYGENTLSITFIEGSYRILRATWNDHEPRRPHKRMTSVRNIIPAGSLDDDLGAYREELVGIEADEVLGKMRKVHLQTMFYDYFTEHLSDPCRWLGASLRGKVVSVDAPRVSFALAKLTDKRISYPGVCLQKPSKLMAFEDFKAALVLRCASIRFACTNPCDQERLAHIITSNKSSFNTYDNALSLLEDLFVANLWRCGYVKEDMEHILDELSHDLVSASLSYDPMVYGKARVNYLNTLEPFLLKDYMDDFVRFQDAQVSESEEIESAERYLSQVEASLYESFNDSKVPDNEFQEQLSLPNLVQRHAESRVQELRWSRDENKRRAEECSEQTIRDLFKRAIEPTRKIRGQMNGGDSAYVVVEFER